MSVTASNNPFPHDPKYNFGDKLDRGGYPGTAQDLKNDIDAIAKPDGFLKIGVITKVGNLVTIPENEFEYRIDQIEVSNQDFSTTIAAATDGYRRIDIIVGLKSGSFVKIQGIESIDSPQEPQVPDETIRLTSFNVFGAEIGDPSIPNTGDVFVQKSEQYPISVTGGGGGTFSVDSEKGYFEISNYSTHIVNIEDQQGYIYLGREITFRNTGTQDLTFQHNAVASEMNKKFFTFPGEENFILKPLELLTLKLGSNGRLNYVGASDPKKMDKAIYDTTNNGIVDGAEGLVRLVFAQEAIAKGDPVYVSSTGDPTFVMRARADNNAKMPAFAIAQEAIASGSVGKVTINGSIRGLNTGSLDLGKNIYVGATGGITSTKPTTNAQIIGVSIETDASDGVIVIDPQPIFDIDQTIIEGSANAVSGGAVFDALDSKANKSSELTPLVDVVNDGTYSSFPSITKLTDGTLFSVYRKGTLHTSLDGAIVGKKSTDNGVTWGNELIIVPFINGNDFRDPNITLLGNGQLIVSYFRVTQVSPYNGSVFCIKSSNNGSSWGTPISVGGFSGQSAVSAPVVEIASNNIVLPLYGFDGAVESIKVMKSINNGDTWSLFSTIVSDSYTGDLKFTEPTISNLGGGKLLATIRHSATFKIATSLSFNNGSTWTAYVDRFDGNSRATVLNQNGKISLLFRDYPTGDFVLRTSEDDFSTYSSKVLIFKVEAGVAYEYCGVVSIQGDVFGLVYALGNGAPSASVKFKYLNGLTSLGSIPSISTENLQVKETALFSKNILFDRDVSSHVIGINGDNTLSNTLIFQAGNGFANYGGALNLFSHSHPTKPGWATIGISNNSGGKFSINSKALGGGNDVFTVEGATGNTGIGTSNLRGALSVKLGNTVTTDLVNQDNGSISFGNGATGFDFPVLQGKSSNNTGLFFLSGTPNTNPGADMIFNVRQNNNTDFSTLTTSAFRLVRFGTTLMDMLRNGNTTFSGSTTATQFRVSALNTAPASSTAPGTAGDIRYTATGIFWCIATNSWIRVTGSTF